MKKNTNSLFSNYKEDLEKIYSLNYVIAIIQFGSSLNNKTKSNLSDLDICIITKKNISTKQKEKILFYKDETLDLNIFDDLGLPMQYEILTKGKIITNKKDIKPLIKSIKHEWNDFKPILNRIYIKKGLLPII